jgi:hypothetical protein
MLYGSIRHAGSLAAKQLEFHAAAKSMKIKHSSSLSTAHSQRYAIDKNPLLIWSCRVNYEASRLAQESPQERAKKMLLLKHNCN